MAAYTPSLSMAKPKDRARRRPSEAPPRDAPPAGAVIDEAERKTDGAPLLFCPFCRECFEGELRCPEHELLLVPWEELPRSEEPEELGLEDAVSPVDPRFGRGELAAGVVLLMISVLTPLFTVSEGGDSHSFTLLEAATGRAPNLWTIPFVAALVLSVMLRRRTIGQMLGARLAMLILATGPFLSLFYTLWKVYGGAAQLGEALHRDVQVSLGWGVGLVIAGGILLVVGSIRLGTSPQTSRGPRDHGDGPDADAPIRR